MGVISVTEPQSRNEEVRPLDIIVAGNANIDTIIQVPSLPLEDEKIQIQSVTESLVGSAANYAVSIARLGGSVGFLGNIGKDANGEQLLSAFKMEGVDISYVREQDQRTGFALVITANNGRHFVLRYSGANEHLDPINFPKAYLEQAKLLHISGPSPLILNAITKTIEEVGIPLSMDPGQTLLHLGLRSLAPFLQQAHLLFMNQVEFQMLTGESPSLSRVGHLAEDLGLLLSIQRGENGVYVSDGTVSHEIPAFTIRVVDSIGAGDTYASAFTMALFREYNLQEAAIYGCAAAAIKCLHLGARTGMPTHDQVLHFLTQHHQSLDDKAISLLPPSFIRGYPKKVQPTNNTY